MRDKQFLINSIKMDLHRVVTASGDVSKPFPKESVRDFLNHALKDLSKIETTSLEDKLKQNLSSLLEKIDFLENNKTRLKWAEDILTTRCRFN